MKEKKWLLLFALVLIGVLGNCGESYAADYIYPDTIDEDVQEMYKTDLLDFHLGLNNPSVAEIDELVKGKGEWKDGYLSTCYLIYEHISSTAKGQNHYAGYFSTDAIAEEFGEGWYPFLCVTGYGTTKAILTLQIAKSSGDGGLYIDSFSALDVDYHEYLAAYTDSNPLSLTVGDLPITYESNTLGDEDGTNCFFSSWNIPIQLTSVSDIPDRCMGRLATNLPIFKKDDTDGILAYVENADVSGAMNASGITPEPETSYTDKNLYLKNIQYTSSYLKLRPVGSAYAEWTYFPVYDGYDLDNCELEVYYEWSYGAEVLSKKTVGISDTFYSTESYSLSEKRNGISLWPYTVICDMILDLPAVLRDCLQGCCFGGSFSGLNDIGNFYGIQLDGSQLLQMSSSIMKVSFRVKGKSGNNYQYGKMYTYVIDLLTGETEEHVASSDDEGNYTNKEQYKVYDTDGNVTVKTDATSGGSSSSSDNSFTVQDGAIQINVNPTFNVEGGAGGNGGNGGDGGDGGNGGWSFDFGSSGDNDGDGEDDGDGIHGISIKEFLALITGGIGLLGSNGLVSMLAETFSFVPEEFWRVVIFGMVAMIVVAIMRKF